MTKAKKTNRAHGMGSVFKRSNGNYYLQYMINGKTKKISLKSKSKNIALKTAEQILKPAMQARTIEQVQLNIAENKKIISSSELTFEKIINNFLVSSRAKNITEKSRKNYIAKWEHFINFINENYSNINNIMQVDKLMINNYFESLWNKNISSRTYNQYIEIINFLVNFTAKNIDINIKIFNNIEKKKLKTISKRNFTPEQITSIFDTVTGDYRILFYIAMYTGLRLKDAINLRYNNIDFDAKMIKVLTAKTQTEVEIPLHQDLEKELLKIEKSSEYILPELVEKYQKRNDLIFTDIQKILEKSGIETRIDTGKKNKSCIYGFHSFRHTFVSLCANAGVDLAVVQAIVGHSGLAMTQHYTHISTDVKMAAVSKLSINGATFLTDTAKIKKIRDLIGDNNSALSKQILKIISTQF